MKTVTSSTGREFTYEFAGKEGAWHGVQTIEEHDGRYFARLNARDGEGNLLHFRPSDTLIPMRETSASIVKHCPLLQEIEREWTKTGKGYIIAYLEEEPKAFLYVYDQRSRKSFEKLYASFPDKWKTVSKF